MVPLLTLSFFKQHYLLRATLAYCAPFSSQYLDNTQLGGWVSFEFMTAALQWAISCCVVPLISWYILSWCIMANILALDFPTSSYPFHFPLASAFSSRCWLHLLPSLQNSANTQTKSPLHFPSSNSPTGLRPFLLVNFPLLAHNEFANNKPKPMSWYRKLYKRPGRPIPSKWHPYLFRITPTCQWWCQRGVIQNRTLSLCMRSHSEQTDKNDYSHGKMLRIQQQWNGFDWG